MRPLAGDASAGAGGARAPGTRAGHAVRAARRASAITVQMVLSIMLAKTSLPNLT